MAKLEIKNWKGYKVGDLFSATRGISFKMQGLLLRDTIMELLDIIR